MNVGHDPLESAEEAGLRYVTDAQPGIRRSRAGRGFRYVGPDGQRIRPATAGLDPAPRHPARLDRRLDLPDQRGHLQATGRDARGRKQYRYHPRWRASRDEVKYDRMLAFGQALPRIRRRVDEDLRAATACRARRCSRRWCGCSRRRCIRVGNEEYARDNRSFGLTTLRDRHVEVGSADDPLPLPGQGRQGARSRAAATARLARDRARAARSCPARSCSSTWTTTASRGPSARSDVNDYLREITGERLHRQGLPDLGRHACWPRGRCRSSSSVDSEAQAKKKRGAGDRSGRRGARQHAGRLAQRLRPPGVIDAYLEGDVVRAARQRADRALDRELLLACEPEEAAVLALLRRRLPRGRGRQRAASGGSKPLQRAPVVLVVRLEEDRHAQVAARRAPVAQPRLGEAEAEVRVVGQRIARRRSPGSARRQRGRPWLKYARPSASRIEALPGSRRQARSSSDRGGAGMMLGEQLRAAPKELVGRFALVPDRIGRLRPWTPGGPAEVDPLETRVVGRGPGCGRAWRSAARRSP